MDAVPMFPMDADASLVNTDSCEASTTCTSSLRDIRLLPQDVCLLPRAQDGRRERWATVRFLQEELDVTFIEPFGTHWLFCLLRFVESWGQGLATCAEEMLRHHAVRPAFLMLPNGFLVMRFSCLRLSCCHSRCAHGCHP